MTDGHHREVNLQVAGYHVWTIFGSFFQFFLGRGFNSHGRLFNAVFFGGAVNSDACLGVVNLLVNAVGRSSLVVDRVLLGWFG